MYFDESSNSSTCSTVYSSKATMFMIDNLLLSDTSRATRSPPGLEYVRARHVTSFPPIPLQTSTLSSPVIQAVTSYENINNPVHHMEKNTVDVNEKSDKLVTKRSSSSSPAKKRQRIHSSSDGSNENTPPIPRTFNDEGSSGEKKKKSRTSFTNRQLNELESVFRGQRYLPTAERKRLAKNIQLSDQQIKTWFQNRRMKDKRISRDEASVRDPLMPIQLVMTSAHMQSPIGHNMIPSPMTSHSRGSPEHQITCHPAISPSASSPSSVGSISPTCFDFNGMFPFYSAAQANVHHSLRHGSLSAPTFTPVIIQ